MALGDPNQDEQEQTPTSIVAPWNTNMDYSTMQWNPEEFTAMTANALGGLGGVQAQPEGRMPVHIPAEESHSLLNAIDSGYADPKVIKPVQMIREGIQKGDEDLVKKGHRNMMNLLLGDRSFGDWYSDTFLRSGTSAAMAQRLAGEVVMKELQQHAQTGSPRAEEAVRLGLISPHELIPGEQLQDSYAHLIPHEPFAFNDDGMPKSAVKYKSSPAQPDQEATQAFVPNARLTPLQQEIALSRQRGLSAGVGVRQQYNQSRSELNREKAETERYKREHELPDKQAANNALVALRKAQAEVAHARVDWLKKLPDLKRELSGTPTFELDALKRVHTSIQKKEPIDKADWLIAERWLRKGSPRFSVDFMGKAFDRMTGQSERSGGPFAWTGLPNPPDTGMTPEAHKEVQDTDQDMFHQFSTFLGTLLGGSDKPATTTKPTAPPGLTAEEKAELEALKKKHGR